MRKFFFFLLFTTVFCFFYTSAIAATIEERVVPLGHGISGEEIYVNSLKISPDYMHIGYVSRIGGSFRVWLDGVSKKSYKGITQESPFFSPEKNRLAFIANEKDSMFVVVDNQEHKHYKRVDTLTFSPDGTRLAYRAEDEEGHQMVVIDGKPGPEFGLGINKSTGIIFSPDSKQVCYIGITKNSSQIFVKNHKKKRGFQTIGQVLFSPDSSHVAYTAQKDGGWHVVLDNNLGPAYKKVSDLKFSPDGTQLVYTAQKNRRYVVVKNNKEIREGYGVFSPIFSPGGNFFAFLAFKKNNKYQYIVNEEPGLTVDKPGRLIFSRDDTSFSYAALIGDQWHVIKDGVKGPGFTKIFAFSYSPTSTDILYVAENAEAKKTVVNNSVPGEFYESIGVPVFSPNGKHYAYVAGQGKDDEMFMVINGKKQKPYPIIGITVKQSRESKISSQQPFFSSTGNRMAYPVYDPEKEKAFMVVDGYAHPPFDAVMKPCFSSDEKHVAYMGKKGDAWHLVVDGKAGKHSCDGMIRGATIAYNSDLNCFFILGASQTETGLSFFRIEAEIKAP